MDTINNILVMTRGDDFYFTVDIPQSNLEPQKEITMEGGDILYVGIMDPHQPFEDAIIKKRYTAADLDKYNRITVHIVPEDTIDLVPGKYYYSVKVHYLHMANTVAGYIDEVSTIINKAKFIICD